MNGTNLRESCVNWYLSVFRIADEVQITALNHHSQHLHHREGFRNTIPKDPILQYDAQFRLHECARVLRVSLARHSIGDVGSQLTLVILF